MNIPDCKGLVDKKICDCAVTADKVRQMIKSVNIS